MRGVALVFVCAFLLSCTGAAYQEWRGQWLATVGMGKTCPSCSLRIGMTKLDVISCMGAASSITQTVTAHGMSEQYVYGITPTRGPDRTVYYGRVPVRSSGDLIYSWGKGADGEVCFRRRFSTQYLYFEHGVLVGWQK